LLIDQQLAPLHADNVFSRSHPQIRDRELRRSPRLVLFDDDIAGGRAMKTSLPERHHIERHHAGQHAPAAEAFAQHGNIADAVLQADDDRIGRRVPGDQTGDIGGIGAFHGDQHHAGLLEDRRVVR